MSQSRQLAAIMFTDIVGYTALMSRDEQKAMQLLQKNRDIQNSLAEKHTGELLKEIGDGTLLCFHSAFHAVQCAIEIQKSCKEVPELVLRIGIHLGDVLFENGDVFGDGVNVASRIEPFANAGGICISEQVFQMIQNKPGGEAEFIGEKKLKNVDRPIAIYNIGEKNSSSGSYKSSPVKNPGSNIKSIAVLPFTNMSNDSEQEYFCDGLTEDILNNLTCVDDLQIVSRTSSFALKGINQDIREIGRALGAQNIVDGSVRKAGNRIRVSVQLIKVSDGFMLWSEKYDRELKDIFEIQDEIALSICSALEARLSEQEQQVIEKVKTQDIKAYDFYMRGRHYYRSLKNKFKLAIEMFQKAIQKDPNYALAYAGLADCYSYIYLWFQLDKEILDQALSASQKALELDPNLAEAHLSRGLTMAITSEHGEAEKAFEKTIQLNPQLFEAYYQFGRTCMGQGKHEQAQTLFEKASQLQPDSYESALLLAASYRETDGKTAWKHQCRKAVAVTRNHLDLYPEDTRALCLGAIALVGTGEPEEAVQWIENALALEPNEMTVLYNATCTYSLLGQYDRALDLFEQRAETGSINRAWLDNDADLDPIRNHPRFQKALKKLAAGS
jgi:adenylate cyclase